MLHSGMDGVGLNLLTSSLNCSKGRLCSTIGSQAVRWVRNGCLSATPMSKCSPTSTPCLAPALYHAMMAYRIAYPSYQIQPGSFPESATLASHLLHASVLASRTHLSCFGSLG